MPRRRITELRTPIQKVDSSILSIKQAAITPAILEETSIIERLNQFLTNEVELERRKELIPEATFEELTLLYRKWSSGDLLVHASRGIIYTTSSRTRARIDPSWPHSRQDNYFGHGHLVNGQTWCYRIEMSRDGAHGPLIAGIAGTTEHGARSIVMGCHASVEKGTYADIDEGDTI